MEYLQPNKAFLKIGCKSFATKKTEFNARISYVLNNAVGGIAPNFTVDYANALLSRGSLSKALNPTTDLTTAGQVSFAWDDNSLEGNANATDKAMVLVYNPSKKNQCTFWMVLIELQVLKLQHYQELMQAIQYSYL